jgi:hypothetical protein
MKQSANNLTSSIFKITNKMDSDSRVAKVHKWVTRVINFPKKKILTAAI